MSKSSSGSFGIFVTHLCLSDFCMGLYLCIIGISDANFRGEYIHHDLNWRFSEYCTIAGIISVISAEVSSFTICLITLDRFLVLRFPFSSAHFSRISAICVCVIAWVVGSILALVPLVPSLKSDWDFYAQTSICLPLPFYFDDEFAGYIYAFSVMVALNFALFCIIATGQIMIYFSIQSSKMDSSSSTASKKDATIARRLTTIAVSNFLCWFPVGLAGVLAINNVGIPAEVNVAVVIFVLPLNSAINPFLYTFNLLIEKRRKAKEAVLMSKLEKELNLTSDYHLVG